MPISPANTIIRAIVPKTVASTIRRMATVTGKSQSAVIAEFLTEAEPAIRRLAGMLEVAKQQQSLFPKSSVAELEAALDEMSGNAVEVMDKLESALQLPLEPSQAKGKRGAKPSPAGRVATRRRKRLPPA